MQHHPVTNSIVDLPDEVLSAVVTALTSYAHGNPGDVCRLMLSCKRLKASMHTMEPFWQRQCLKQGWGEPSEADATLTSFDYYSKRMLLRWQVRSAFRQVIPFLDYTSQAALQPGASVQQLEACQARLGVTFPWQFWEMYRFRNGQDNQLNIDFAYGGRLLSLAELSLDIAVPFSTSIGGMQSVCDSADKASYCCHPAQQGMSSTMSGNIAGQSWSSLVAAIHRHV
ncbi:hypothetical protein ABBQ38_005502 [Trebouxia sp. C0009 RCD-2024]